MDNLPRIFHLYIWFIFTGKARWGNVPLQNGLFRVSRDYLKVTGNEPFKKDRIDSAKIDAPLLLPTNILYSNTSFGPRSHPIAHRRQMTGKHCVYLVQKSRIYYPYNFSVQNIWKSESFDAGLTDRLHVSHFNKGFALHIQYNCRTCVHTWAEIPDEALLKRLDTIHVLLYEICLPIDKILKSYLWDISFLVKLNRIVWKA